MMIYGIPVERMLQIERVYTVTRKTVWQVADPSHIVILIAEGQCRFEFSNRSVVVQEGDVVFIPAGQTYRRSPVEDILCTMMYIHFVPHGMLLELKNEEAARLIVQEISKAEHQLLDGRKIFSSVEPILYLAHLNTGRKEEILEGYKELRKALNEYRSYNGLYITYGICRILSLLSLDLRRTLLAGNMEKELISVPVKLKKAVWYVKQNESEHISLEDLCRYCNVSSSQMIRYFKDGFGKTPIQFINEYKVDRAREMMEIAPGLAIKNICDALGFEDPHYFSRLFSHITGESPSEYKNRVTNFKKSKY